MRGPAQLLSCSVRTQQAVGARTFDIDRSVPGEVGARVALEPARRVVRDRARERAEEEGERRPHRRRVGAQPDARQVG